MNSLLRVPAVNSNEESATLVEWLKPAGELVRKGETLCTIETTKSVADIVSEEEGYLFPLFKTGDEVQVGAPIAALMASRDADVNTWLESLKEQTTSVRRWTKKAEITAKKIGVDLEALGRKHPGKVLGEADVLAVKNDPGEIQDLLDGRYPEQRKERVLLIGGGRGGGIVTLDALALNPNQRAVGILDNDPVLHGKTMMGIPILGGSDLAVRLWEEQAFDAAIIVVTADIDERVALFENLKNKGIRFTNVIDPNVTIKMNVALGVGNLILGSSYLSSCVEIGDNNFLASHTCIEHHSTVGSHCTFGPRCTTSGSVSIGSKVKLGMGVLIEPHLKIGDCALIPSGAVVTRDIPEQSVLKIKQVQSVRPLKGVSFGRK